jgi:dTDP-glucose 4,6-dehydratase
MKIVITGGAGFIGSHFVKYCLKKYPRAFISNIDKLTYCGNLDNLAEVSQNKRYQFIKSDICSWKVVDRITQGCDVLVHFAAETHVDRSIQGADAFVKTNVLGTQVLLKAALKNKIKRFIHVSTDEVYGSRKTGFFKETDCLNPSSPYSASKAGSDLLVLSYAKTHGLPAVITRSSNNFGPHQYPEKIIPLFITNLMRNKEIPLYASGKNIRDWIFVEDHCRAIDLVMNKGKDSEIYNVGAGYHLDNLGLTKKILGKMNKPFSLVRFVADRPAHDFRYALNLSKITNLGFKPRYSFDQALDRTIAWYQERICKS